MKLHDNEFLDPMQTRTNRPHPSLKKAKIQKGDFSSQIVKHTTIVLTAANETCPL